MGCGQIEYQLLPPTSSVFMYYILFISNSLLFNMDGYLMKCVGLDMKKPIMFNSPLI